MHLPNIQKIILISFICVGTANCSSLDKTTQPVDTKQAMDLLRKEIKLIIGDAKCSDDKQCKSLAMGAKACGGPISYEVYSSLNTDTEKLSSLGEQLKTLNKRYNKEEGLMSDCMMVMPPRVGCLDKICQKK